MRDAIKLAIADEMRADPSVVVFGEDVADAGGVFKVTVGLVEEFGRDRVRDTPWPVLWTGFALMITTLGFTMFGETLRDVVDPRLAGMRRWRRP